jgi:DNA-directed RNA polymerase subunit H (RpoH/RPB5)
MITLPIYHYRTPTYTKIVDQKEYLSDLRVENNRQLPKIRTGDPVSKMMGYRRNEIYEEEYYIPGSTGKDKINFCRTVV